MCQNKFIFVNSSGKLRGYLDCSKCVDMVLMGHLSPFFGVFIFKHKPWRDFPSPVKECLIENTLSDGTFGIHL